MTNEDDLTTPTEGSPTWVAELRRRCPTAEEIDALFDIAERLADIERGVRELADNLREEAARKAFHEYEEGLRDKAGIVEEHLRDILNPET